MKLLTTISVSLFLSSVSSFVPLGTQMESYLKHSEPGVSRQKRIFSLFSVVQFENIPCPIQSAPNSMGTCLSSAECSNQRGTADGKCAAGFGVCCLFAISGCTGTVSRNCTYVRNMGFPGMDGGVSRDCSYSFVRYCKGICQMRLDFEPTTSLPIDSAIPGNCGGTGDALTVMSPFSASAAAFPPVICGMLTGQHMYFETGSGDDLVGGLRIIQGTGTGDRRYNIKVTYIECDNLLRAPSGCAQYFIGEINTISSYNFAGGQILGGQDYQNCIRQEKGFCSVTYKESQITNPDPFFLSNAISTQDNCNTNNFVTIPSMVVQTKAITAPSRQEVTVVPSMRCGQVFGALPEETTPGSLTSLENVPFVVGFHTTPGGADQAGRTGFSLDYMQVPC